MATTVPKSAVLATRNAAVASVRPSSALFAPSPRVARPVVARAQANDSKTDNGVEEGGIVSGEWAVNWSLSSYEDCSAYYEDKIFHEKVEGGMRVGDIMTTSISVAYVDQTREDITELFDNYTGVPVVDEDMVIRGILSKKDLTREGNLVKDIMSSPPVFAKPNQVVSEIVCLMFRNKVWRIPVVNDELKLVGLVTRTDVFTAVALENAVPMMEKSVDEVDF